MEKTTVTDNNSESDIFDSWAVIDDDSPLEWNNELRSSQYDFMKSRIGLGLPRPSSSKGDLSDGDSIEVVPEDYDNLSDKGAEDEVVQDEKWTGTDQLESNENIGTESCRHGPTPDLPHYTTEPKKISLKWRESNPILIAILIMGIVGGLCFGYLWASHSKSEDSSSIQITRALLTKLENEIKFLHWQLRSAKSSLKPAVSKIIPKLKHNITKQDLHTSRKKKLFKDSYPGMCPVTDAILKSRILQDNFSKEYCLASDEPQANEISWTSRAGNMSVNIAHISSSSNTNALKKHLEVNTRVNNNKLNESTTQYIPYDVEKVYQTFQESSEKASFEPLDSLQHVNNTSEAMHSPLDVIAEKRSGNSAVNEKNMSSSDGINDPRPYTKLRNTMERIYTILSVIQNENQTGFPSQLELLRTLPQNIVALHISKEHFTSNVHDKISSFRIQMQDSTQKRFADIDASINNFVQHIAFKIKEMETINKKQICKLKTSLESSVDYAILNLNHEPIFKKCMQDEKQNDHDDLVTNGNKHEIKDPLAVSKEMHLVSESSTYDEDEPSEQPWMVKGKEYFHREHRPKHRSEHVQQSDTQHMNVESGEKSSVFGDKKGMHMVSESSFSDEDEPSEQPWIVNGKEYFHRERRPKHRNENEQQSDTQHMNVEPGETRSVFGDKKGIKQTGDLNKKSPKIKKKSQLKESTGKRVQPEGGTYLNRESKTDHSAGEMKPKIVKAAKNNKSSAKYSELHVAKTRGRSGLKKTLGINEKKDFNESHGKDKKNMKKSSKVVDTNVSGEWAMKMAHGRAEHRRREHQTDWVFERAQARTSNRGKTVKESNWRNDRDYCSTILNFSMYNNSMPFKDQTCKSWKRVKQHMKKTLWKPLIDSAKSVKNAFYKFNNKIRHHQYHSRQE